MMRFILILSFSLMGYLCEAQSAQAYFNTSANHYVSKRDDKALQSVNEGLARYPNDSKLQALKEKMEKEKKEQEKKEDEQKQDQENKDQDKKDQEQKDKEEKEKEQKEKEQKEKEEQKKDQEKKDKNQEQKEKEEQEKKEQEKKDLPPSVKEKLEQMQISEEKAKMLLDAMRAQEVQYLQQNKRKATKPKEKGKPDW